MNRNGFGWDIRDQHSHDRNALDLAWFYVGTHNVYYVKYGGFALKFMSPSLSGTYR